MIRVRVRVPLLPTQAVLVGQIQIHTVLMVKVLPHQKGIILHQMLT